MNVYEAKRPNREPTHPGELLPDIIKESGMSVTGFAKALHLSRGLLYQMIAKEKPVSTETALKLGVLVGNGATLWLNMQRNWDVWNAEKKLDPILRQMMKAAIKESKSVDDKVA